MRAEIIGKASSIKFSQNPTNNSENLGLHEADVTYQENPVRGAQFYPSCTQVTITGSGTTTPTQNFNFVGGYLPTTPGIKFNIYSKTPSRSPTYFFSSLHLTNITNSQYPTQFPALLFGSRLAVVALPAAILGLGLGLLPNMVSAAVLVTLEPPAASLEVRVLASTTTTISASKCFNLWKTASPRLIQKL